MIKKINNKILNTLVANIIVKHCHKDEIDYVKRFGFTIRELKEWLNLIFVNKLYSLYKDHPLIEWILCSLCEAEMELKSKKPDKVSDDFIETYFTPDLKLNKQAKKAIREEDSDLLAVLVPEEKRKIKIAIS